MSEQLYRLVSRDGMKSPLRELFGRPSPEIKTALKNNIPVYASAEFHAAMESGPIIEDRRYRLRRVYSVEVYEYEEV